jgi:hypothetical protein
MNETDSYLMFYNLKNESNITTVRISFLVVKTYNMYVKSIYSFGCD